MKEILQYKYGLKENSFKVHLIYILLHPYMFPLHHCGFKNCEVSRQAAPRALLVRNFCYLQLSVIWPGFISNCNPRIALELEF